MKVTKLLHYLVSAGFYFFLSVTNVPIAKAYTDANSDLATGVAPRGMAWGNSGLRLVTVGETNSITQFTCSTAYDVSSCSSDGSIDADLSNETGVDFNGDGSSLFISTSSGDQVREVSLTTNWTPLDGISVGAAITTDDNNQDTDLQFSTDGTMLFVVDHKSDRIKKYELDSAYTITAGSTISSTQQSAQSEDTNTRGLGFSPDGLIMYMIGLSFDRPRMYTMTAPYDLSTSVAVGTQATPGGQQFTNILFNADGSKMYMGDVGGTIYEYDLDDAYESINIPTIDSSTPADNATGVEVDANIVLNWDQAVDAESGNILIKKTSDNSTVATIDVTGDQVTGSGSTTITINPTDDLDASTEYYITIATTAFDNAGSVSYPGMTGTEMLSFTTGEASSSSSTTDPTTDKHVVASVDSQITFAKQNFTQSVGMISNRMSYLRQNKNNSNLSRNNINLDLGNPVLTSLSNTIEIKVPSLVPENWSTWSEGSISLTNIKGNSNSSKKDIDSRRLAFGFDKKINDEDLFGFALQYGHSDTDIGSNGTAIDTDSYSLSFYRTKPLNNENFIEGMIGLGLIKSDLIRISGSNSLIGSRDGTQIFTSLNYGKTFDKRNFNLTPVARVDLALTELESYTETGTDALKYDKQNIKSGLASLGLELSDAIEFTESSFNPFGSIEYGLDFSNSSDAKMSYVSDTSTTYTYTKGPNSTHLLSSEAGFTYDKENGINILASYKRTQGNAREHSDTYRFGANFKSKRETEYAMTLDGNNDLNANFNIDKKINGFDLILDVNQSFVDSDDNNANIALSTKY